MYAIDFYFTQWMQLFQIVDLLKQQVILFTIDRYAIDIYFTQCHSLRSFHVDCNHICLVHMSREVL